MIEENQTPSTENVEAELRPEAAPHRRDNKVRRTLKRIAVGLGLIVLTLASGGAGAYIMATFFVEDGGDTFVVTSATSDGSGSSVVDMVADSVVSISVEATSFSIFGREIVTEGAGTGFIVSEDGLILTNYHVIEGADKVTVVTSKDAELSATVVKSNSAADLAILKVTSETKLRAVNLGDSDALKVGEDVLAIGNALGRYRNTVTRGIVSGLGRPITAGDSGLRGKLVEFEDLIQTDAAINAGNSGGPLINTKGEVIGINTAVDGNAQGIGFSVPINRAKSLIEEAKSA